MSSPIRRLSQVMAFGGEVISAYGWTELIAPGGIPLRVRIDETRRDPFEFIALRTGDLARAVAHYKQELGMSVVSETSSRKQLQLTGRTLFANTDAIEPDREAGSTLLSFGDPSLAASLLLLKPKSRRSRLKASGTALTVVGAGDARTALSPDGFESRLVSLAAFEAVSG